MGALNFLQTGNLRGAHAPWRPAVTKHRDVPMDFANACFGLMTEQAGDSLVVALEAKDFSVYRRRGRQVVPFLAPRK